MNGGDAVVVENVNFVNFNVNILHLMINVHLHVSFPHNNSGENRFNKAKISVLSATKTRPSTL